MAKTTDKLLSNFNLEKEHTEQIYTREYVVEFAKFVAKYYVTEALKEASKKGLTFIPSHTHLHGTNAIDINSILIAYPLENIN